MHISFKNPATGKRATVWVSNPSIRRQLRKYEVRGSCVYLKPDNQLSQLQKQRNETFELLRLAASQDMSVKSVIPKVVAILKPVALKGAALEAYKKLRERAIECCIKDLERREQQKLKKKLAEVKAALKLIDANPKLVAMLKSAEEAASK